MFSLRLRRPRGLMLVVVVMLAITIIPKTPHPWLVYNPTASVPTGLYWITPTDTVHVGDMVLMQTPPSVAGLADQRRYLPRGVPMLKYVAALPGDRVCASGATISINQRAVAERQARDHLNRVMPWWSGCQTLGADDLFVLNAKAPLSFDGRYFGIVSKRLIRGKAKRL